MRAAIFTAIILAHLCAGVFAPSVLAAQSQSAPIEALLRQEAVTYAQAARFILDAAGLLTDAGGEGAFLFAGQRGWLPRNAQQETQARLDGVSLLIMNAFEIQGGLFYTITKAPHYAYRELVRLGIIQGRTTPGMKISGEQLILITDRVLAFSDENASLRRATAEPQSLVREDEEAAPSEIIRHEPARQTVEANFPYIMFSSDSTELSDSEKAKLHEIAAVLRNIPDARLLIAGHSAMAGSQDNRLRVAMERARTVADYLISIGACGEENIFVISYGAERPVAGNADEAGMALNRRVEIKIRQ